MKNQRWSKSNPTKIQVFRKDHNLTSKSSINQSHIYDVVIHLRLSSMTTCRYKNTVIRHYLAIVWFWTRYKTEQKGHKRLAFYLFLKLVQINYIFSDNTCTFVYCIFTWSGDVVYKHYRIIAKNIRMYLKQYTELLTSTGETSHTQLILHDNFIYWDYQRLLTA